MTKKFNESRYKVPIVFLGLFFILAVSYLPVINNDFINFDDTGYVIENRFVKAGFDNDNIIWAFTTGHMANWHPVTWLSHILDFTLFGLNPAGHHWMNLCLHIFNTLLLFGILNKMTGGLWRSAIVAALFGLHPLHVESIAWVSERKDVLSTMFWMLSMWAYSRFVIERKGIDYLLLIVFFVLGLMSKPMLVTLPFVLLLLDYWPLKRFQSDHSDKIDVGSVYPLIQEKFPLFLLSAVSCGITFFVQQAGGAVKSITEFPFSLIIANALVTYIDYLKKMVLPTKLAVLYPHVEIAFYNAVMAFIILAAITVIIVWSRRKYPFLLTGWFWYLGTLIPVIGLIQVGHQRMADRYTYIPLIGIFIILAWGGKIIMSRWRMKTWAVATIVGVIIVIFGVMTHCQVLRWRDSVTLWTHTIHVTEPNCWAHYSLGQAFQEQEEIGKALSHYKKALKICPEFDMAHNNFGGIKYRQGDLESAEYHFRQVLRVNPHLPSANNNLGVLLMSKGKIEKAITHFKIATDYDPENIDALNNLANALSNNGKFHQAIDYYQRAIDIDPTLVSAQYNLGKLLAEQKKYKAALRHFAEVIRLEPLHSHAYNASGIILAKMGLYQKARFFLKKALDLDPNYNEAITNLKLLDDHIRS